MHGRKELPIMGKGIIEVFIEYWPIFLKGLWRNIGICIYRCVLRLL
jgi:hypothetical protein